MTPQFQYKTRITWALCIITSNVHAFSTSSNSSDRGINTAFVVRPKLHTLVRPLPQQGRSDHVTLFLRPPPGSGYMSEEDEQSFFPDTYEPMMEYPGTMRPGRTPENQPFSSLPIQESDPDPVPWPHFQEIEWHHNWGSPHEHPIPMEDFIEMQGRWASAEMEAEMRAGARRGVRERREIEESQKAASFILDDDDEEDEEDDEIKIDFGEGVNAFLDGGKKKTKAAVAEDEEEDEVEEDDGTDDFLLDLGLDGEDDVSLEDEQDEEEETDRTVRDKEPAFASRKGSKGILETMQSMIDADDGMDETDDTDIDLNFDDLDLDFGDDDDEESGMDDDGDDDEFMMDDFDINDEDDDEEEEDDMIPLDDMIGDEDMGEEDEFDDGGFDYD